MGIPPTVILVVVHRATEIVDPMLHEPLQAENFMQQSLLDPIRLGRQLREIREIS